MSRTRFRQIDRLETLAQPYIQTRRQLQEQWRSTLMGAAAHAAVLAFLIRYGKPKIDEPLSHACERCTRSPAWMDCCKQFKFLLPSRCYTHKSPSVKFEPHSRDRVDVIGAALRHVLISEYSGADEKQKLEIAFASAPPWVLWFTLADYTAEVLNFTIPDLSKVNGFMRSKANFDLWWGVPSGAFEQAPWPRGCEDEPLARTDLNLLRPTIEDTTRQMTRRELMRERAALKKSQRGERQEAWPPLVPEKILKLSPSEVISLTLRNRDFHHASIGQPGPLRTTRFR